MRHPFACLLLMAPALGAAQSGVSQARLEDDCLQRLRPIVPRDTQVQKTDFAALGNYATYYVVTYRFSGQLRHGSATAGCTYRRSGEWVKDDAAVHKLRSELEASRDRAARR